jgi:hypothetical protein
MGLFNVALPLTWRRSRPMFKPALNIEAGSWLVQASIQQAGQQKLAEIKAWAALDIRDTQMANIRRYGRSPVAR